MAVIEAGQLQFFAKATEQPDPLYFDLEVARRAGYRGLLVPLTFAFSLTLTHPDLAGFGLVQANADPRYILHAEQRFRNHALLFSGDEVTLRTTIEDVVVKKEGQLVFLTQSTTLTNQIDELCVEVVTTFALRIGGI